MAAAKQWLAPEAFLEWEAAQPERYEYVSGEIFAMAGMSDEHNQLATNIVTALAPRLNPPCRVRSEGLKVQVGAGFFYPDALILCGAPVFYETRRDTITNPTVVFEILSDSTEAFDRGEKFRRYRSLESLQAIVFVSQHTPLVECWTRVGDAWRAVDAEALGEEFELAPLNVRVPLAALYDGVAFGESA